MIRTAIIMLILTAAGAVCAYAGFKIFTAKYEKWAEKFNLEDINNLDHPCIIYDRNGNALAISATAETIFLSPKEITDNGDDSFTVTNLTKETIPGVRVFYKYYMKDEGIFVGGIAFTVKLPSLEPNAPMTVRPAHYTSDSVKVVMALTYEEG